MKSPISVFNRKQTASFRIVSMMLAFAPLWLMLAAANTSAQTSNDVSNSTTTTSPAPPPSNWSQFLEDNMQRWNPNETILGVNTVDSLTFKWDLFGELGGCGSGCSSPLLSSPAVVNGVIYFASLDGPIFALDASTGAKLWSFATGGDVISSPAVANGVVYIGSRDGNLYALNASTGAKLWSYATGNQGPSSPAVVNGVVYIGSDDGAGGGNVFALNATTGAKLWVYAAVCCVDSSPAVANGVVYVIGDDGTMYALNASTGAKLWINDLHTGGASSPVVANGVVYIGGGDNLYALNAGTGAQLWSFATGGAVRSSSAVANGAVYVGSGDGNVYALNASTGAKLWSFSGNPIDSSSPAVANGVVYFVGDKFYALNASTGAQLWSFPSNLTPGASSPAIANGMLYIHDAGVAQDLPFTYDDIEAFSLGADLYLRVIPSSTTVHQGDLLTYALPVWNLGPANADHEVLNTQVPAGTTFDSIRISGTPGLGTCTTPAYGGTGQIVCHENGSMAPNTTWTVRLTVKVTAAAGRVITENATTMADTRDPNMANNTATASVNVLGNADLFLQVQPSTTTVHQGDLLTYAFPVWNRGPDNAVQEVLNTQVPAGTTFDYIRISGTPGLGTCTTPPYQGTGAIVCHENASMAPNTTWTVRLTVKVTAPSGTVITENAATIADTPDPNMANNTATASIKVQ
jgi:uncharacterized repeat protein (TIGR01451 family)